MSSEQTKRVFVQLSGPDDRLQNKYGVYYENYAGDLTCLGYLDQKMHAERLRDMFNDSNLDWLSQNFEEDSDFTVKRIAEIHKLFCLQENLTWFDLGFDDECIRAINQILEMPLDLRQQVNDDGDKDFLDACRARGLRVIR
jgi:hypothetical protein